MEGVNVAEERSEADAGQRRVELRVRERTPACVADVIDDVTSRLRRLEGEAVDDVRIDAWGPRRLGSPAESVTTTLEEYEQWAERSGYSLDPAFRRRETGSLLSQESRSELVMPVLSLAVYEGEDLACVTPCTDGTTTYTVEECLDALESGATDPLEAVDERERSTTDATRSERGWKPA